MSVQVYQKKQYKIYKVRNGFIVHNSLHDFTSSHTHIRSFNQAVNLIYLATNKKIPKRVSFYYLESLIRISDNTEYIRKIRQLMEVKKGKRRVKFINRKYRIII